MSSTNDTVFNREFKDMMNGRRAISSDFNLADLPLPALDTMIQGVPKGGMVLIRKIEEPFFDRLNDEEVQLVGRTTLQKRQVLSDGTFRKDKEGKYVTTQIPVPHNCVAVLSPTSIGLKRYTEQNGKRIEHKVSEGYRYVDYVDSKKGRKYIYIIPKEYAYRLSMCALIITPNKRRLFFQGCKLALQNGTYVYLYVIPYKYRDNLDTRVIGVKSNYNFNEEVTKILNYWVSTGVIFDPTLTSLTDQINGVTNLGIEDYEGTVVSEEYRRYTVSMKDEKEEEFQDSLT